jgi:hypothetical protein
MDAVPSPAATGSLVEPGGTEVTRQSETAPNNRCCVYWEVTNNWIVPGISESEFRGSASRGFGRALRARIGPTPTCDTEAKPFICEGDDHAIFSPGCA